MSPHEKMVHALQVGHVTQSLQKVLIDSVEQGIRPLAITDGLLNVTCAFMAAHYKRTADFKAFLATSVKSFVGLLVKCCAVLGIDVVGDTVGAVAVGISRTPSEKQDVDSAFLMQKTLAESFRRRTEMLKQEVEQKENTLRGILHGCRLVQSQLAASSLREASAHLVAMEADLSDALKPGRIVPQPPQPEGSQPA